MTTINVFLWLSQSCILRNPVNPWRYRHMDAQVVTDVTNRLLDRYAEANGLTSDYAIAKALGCANATVRNYRRNITKMDATTATQIAECLRIEPLQVIAAVELERSEKPRTRNVWEKYRGRILLAASIALMPIWGQICANTAQAETTAYTLYARICATLRVWRCRADLQNAGCNP